MSVYKKSNPEKFVNIPTPLNSIIGGGSANPAWILKLGGYANKTLTVDYGPQGVTFNSDGTKS